MFKPGEATITNRQSFIYAADIEKKKSAQKVQVNFGSNQFHSGMET